MGRGEREVPEDVGVSVEFGGPFRLAAVAASLIGCHFGSSWVVDVVNVDSFGLREVAGDVV